MRILALLVLLMVTPHMSFVGIYRCEDAGGKFFFTDNPAILPQGCLAEYVGDMAEVKVADSLRSPPEKAPPGGNPHDQTVDEGIPESVADEYDILKSEAEDLVERFLSTRARVYRATGPRSRNKARLALKEVISQKGPMLSKIN